MQNPINKEQWIEWKRNRVTQELEKSIQSRIEDCIETLTSKVNDRDYDTFIKGMIHGLREVLDIRFGEDSEDKEELKDEI